MTFIPAERLKNVRKSATRILYDNAPPGSINLGLGEPDFPTPEISRRAAIEFINQGFVGYTPNAAFIAAHPGNAGYTAAYSLGRGFVGNPNIRPEISRSFTAGAIIDPVKWLTFTADYFRVRKSNLIITGPLVAENTKLVPWAAANVSVPPPW